MDDGDEKVYLELNLIVHGIVAVIRYCKITLSDVLVSCIQNRTSEVVLLPSAAQRFEYT